MNYILISPHIDDAFLSAGGLIIKLLERGERVRVEYIFTISNWINPSAIAKTISDGTWESVTKQRKTEEIILTRELGYEYNFLDFLDYPLRNIQDKQQENCLAKKIESSIERSTTASDLLLFPIGLDHPDHVLIAEVGKQFFRAGKNVIFYEDMPYRARNSGPVMPFDNFLNNETISSKTIRINYHKKNHFLRYYSSQVSLEWLNLIKSYSYHGENKNFIERYWSTNGLLKKL